MNFATNFPTPAEEKQFPSSLMDVIMMLFADNIPQQTSDAFGEQLHLYWTWRPPQS